MALVAMTPLKWGERTIMPGEPIPTDDVARNYTSMLNLGQIALMPDATPAPKARAKREPVAA